MPSAEDGASTAPLRRAAAAGQALTPTRSAQGRECAEGAGAVVEAERSVTGFLGR